MLNFSTRRIGGLRFFKLGRLCFSFCVTREYKPLARKANPDEIRLLRFRNAEVARFLGAR